MTRFPLRVTQPDFQEQRMTTIHTSSADMSEKQHSITNGIVAVWMLLTSQGETLTLSMSLGVSLTMASKRYPPEHRYRIELFKAGGRGSRLQFKVYDHGEEVALIYNNLWGPNGGTVQQGPEDCGRKISGTEEG